MATITFSTIHGYKIASEFQSLSQCFILFYCKLPWHHRHYFATRSGADLPFHEYHSVVDIFPVRSTLDHMTRSKTCNPRASQPSASSSLDPVV